MYAIIYNNSEGNIEISSLWENLNEALEYCIYMNHNGKPYRVMNFYTKEIHSIENTPLRNKYLIFTADSKNIIIDRESYILYSNIKFKSIIPQNMSQEEYEYILKLYNDSEKYFHFNNPNRTGEWYIKSIKCLSESLYNINYIVSLCKYFFLFCNMNDYMISINDIKPFIETLDSNNIYSFLFYNKNNYSINDYLKNKILSLKDIINPLDNHKSIIIDNNSYIYELIIDYLLSKCDEYGNYSKNQFSLSHAI